MALRGWSDAGWPASAQSAAAPTLGSGTGGSSVLIWLTEPSCVSISTGGGAAGKGSVDCQRVVTTQI
jgi:hypothetical protein